MTKMTKVISTLLLVLCLAPVLCLAGETTECTKVKCNTTDKNGVMLQFFSGHVIANHTIVGSTNHSVIEAEESECIKECIKIKSCITILVAVPETKCWFYVGEDVYANPERLQKKDGYKVISLGNGACRKQPCNFGKCIPDYNRGKYNCECDPGYVGEKCDQAVGPAAYFSFENGTVDDEAVLKLEITLNNGRLVRSPERRGKVVFVGDSQNAFAARLTDVDDETVGWFRNFFRFEKNFTLTMWLKMIPKMVGIDTDVDRQIFAVRKWSVSYNVATKLMKWKIGIHNDIDGNSFAIECRVPDITRWTYFAFAASGVVGQTISKQYVDGELCGQKTLDRSSHSPNSDWNPTYKYQTYHSWVEILVNNQGLALFDELKIFQSYPVSDEVIQDYYDKEKKELMS